MLNTALKAELLGEVMMVPPSSDSQFACHAYADLLEEAGDPVGALAYRTMGWHGWRPGERKQLEPGDIIKKPFVWYKQEPAMLRGFLSCERRRYHEMVWAKLPTEVYDLIRHGNPSWTLYYTWSDAATALGEGLMRVKRWLEVPR